MDPKDFLGGIVGQIADDPEKAKGLLGGVGGMLLDKFGQPGEGLFSRMGGTGRPGGQFRIAGGLIDRLVPGIGGGLNGMFGGASRGGMGGGGFVGMANGYPGDEVLKIIGMAREGMQDATAELDRRGDKYFKRAEDNQRALGLGDMAYNYEPYNE